MSQGGSSAAFLPFLKKKPLAAAPAPVQDDDEDPLAVPLPPAPQPSKLSGSSGTKFVSKLNGKPGPGKPGHVAAAAGVKQPTPPTKNIGIAGANKQTPVKSTAAAALRSLAARPAAGKPGAAGAAANKPGAAGVAKPAALSPAQAKAEAERRRLKQLQRLAKVGLLAQDAPPEMRAKVEQAKQEAAAIQRQHELEAKRKVEMEQRRQQAIQQRQQQEQQRAAVLAEKQRLLAAKLGKAGAAGAGSLRAAGARPGAGAAAAAGPGRGPAGQPQRSGTAAAPAGVGSRGPGGPSSSAAGGRQPPPQHKQQQQQDKDPYAGLNPKQRAFLLARKREREARLGGRPGGGRRGGSHGSDGEGYGGEDDEYDSEDSFIDDDESGDWRRHLRSLTGYDPSRYKDSFFDDRRMEASAAEIQAEERRSARIGLTEDEKEAEAEARRLAVKEAKKKGRKRGAAALFDD